jgi:ribose 5-phosphate isomerase A
MTIYERALQEIQEGEVIGIGSGRASSAFIRLLGERVRQGMRVRGVPTSENSARLAQEVGLPLATLEEGLPLALTVDGADEVDTELNLIKGYGRALVREKIVAASSRRLVILVGPGKEVSRLGQRGKLPVEVVPFALPLCRLRLQQLGLNPVPFTQDDRLYLTDNGNAILDCGTGPIADPAQLEQQIRAIPGVVGTGLFLGMASMVLVGDERFQLVVERKKQAG